MLLQILTILPIILICVDGTTPDHQPHHEQKHAVSSQSYHRDDVPLSYKYTAVHIYTTPHPVAKPFNQQPNHHGGSKYKYIQYAPLEKYNNQNDKHKYKYTPEQAYQNKDEPVSQPQIQHPTEENRIDHLEPRTVAENQDAHEQSIRSYVPGHNIQVHQSQRVLGNNDLYRVYHSNLQNQNVNTPKIAIQPKPEQHVHNSLKIFRPEEHRPLPEGYNILYTLMPRPVLNTPQNSYTAEKPHILHQALSAKIPRLHLNIARVYGIAHLPQQALTAQINEPNTGNQWSHTQAIFLPQKPQTQQKTILYPVQDTNKNYPIHT